MAGKHVNPCCASKEKPTGGTVRKSGRIIAALLLMILAFGIGSAVFVSASAATVASGKCGGSAEWALTEDGTLTISGTGAMEDYKYPANPEWYDHKDMIKTVIFSDGITDIGYGVFADCTALTEVTIPDSVTSIDNFTFLSCDSLTDIDVSQGNEAYCSIDGVLFNKSGSELIRFPAGRNGSYTIPDSVTNIGYGAFFGCAALTEITIPDSVTYIGYGAFSCCTGLTEINIPNSVVIIDNIVFDSCTGLTEINIPDSVTSIDHSAFLCCDSLTDIDVGLGNEVYSSIDGVVFNKSGSELICFPAGRSGSYTIPSGVTSIGDYAFYGDTALTEIFIPASVTSIEWGAFSLWNALSDVYYEGSESDWQKIEIDNYGNISLLNAKIHYNASA